MSEIDQAEHMVAEKFEPLIAVGAVAPPDSAEMCVSARSSSALSAKLIADPLLERASCPWPAAAHLTIVNSLLQRTETRPAPELPGALALIDREEDDLRLADDILERHRCRPG